MLIFTCLFLVVSAHTFAQNKKKNKRADFTMPTEAQQQAYKEYLKRMLADSVHVPLGKRDTVATIQLQTLLKKMKINSDKSLEKEDKDVQNGMLDDDMYMHLGAILSMDELQHLKDFDQRQKAAQEAREKEIKDQQNQQNSQMGNGGRPGGYGGGYGGYRGY